jgi:hypothetical protein
MLRQLLNFLYPIKLSSDSLQGSNYENTIFKLVVLSIALARPITILPVVREITRIRKV